jgi:hypothetical protein
MFTHAMLLSGSNSYVDYKKKGALAKVTARLQE